MEDAFQKLAIPLTGPDGWFVLAPGASSFDSSAEDCVVLLPGGMRGKLSEDGGSGRQLGGIRIKEDGRIRLVETQLYEWGIDGELTEGVDVVSSLENRRKQRWSVRTKNKRVDGGEFCVINHLGLASFTLRKDDDELLRLPLEFVSKKLDFDREYRALTENVAKFCEQLLLQWDTPTSLKFASDPAETRRLLLEQFLFLRSFLTDERLGRLLEAIARNPHSKLEKEYEWRPVGAARSSDYLSDPVRMLRSWHPADGGRSPGEVLDVRKEDTHNTPPNQFIKFALMSFRQLCGEVVSKFEAKDKESSAAAEAAQLMRAVDSLLARRFFREVGTMRRLPLDNQTLQKREGYRDVLRAWILTEAAASLSWEGNEECYDGSTRDVATLYEYWIFIKLHEVLKSLPGLTADEGTPADGLTAEEFIHEEDGQLTIRLKRGKRSRSRFIWADGRGNSLRVHLNYERTFSENAGATASGSYSRRFRPDYTLTLFPEKFATEDAAENHGQVAHLHFDSKYRAEKITQLFGEKRTADEDEDAADLAEEKEEAKVLSTYKRGDLLKMHTYNDALRHTIGSYVLYPGDGAETEKIPKFHEIAPGVGALVMKPENEECLKALKEFISDVLKHQVDRFTQYRYLSDESHRTVSSKPGFINEDESMYQVARKDAPCVLLWLRKENQQACRENGIAYCHAVPKKEDKTLNLNLTIETGSEFIPCGKGQGGKLETLGWRAKVRSAKLVSLDMLKDFLNLEYPESGLKPGNAKHYVLFEFDEVSECPVIDVDEVHKTKRSGSPYMAVSCTWAEIV